MEDDGSFARFIERIKDDYSRGREDFTDMELMAHAQTKYEELVEENQFKGGSKKEDAIVSLTAQIKAMESKLEEVGKNGTRSTPKKKKKKGEGGKKGRGDIEDWKFVPPKDGEPHTKTMVGEEKPWYWCTGHGEHVPRWVRHLPAECEGLKKKNESDKSKDEPKSILKDKSAKEEGSKKVGWSTGMLAKIRALASDSDSDE